ncbi:MAG TPA: NAD(P)-dependent oxidoreductase [Puia sp.]|jgi:nucleoside-diphosphate-sugar epimerase|nr:NAD(P)-dependent oxidoreductase [Puia sp.]
MKKILVTGSTGFLGNYVIKYLLSNNYKVMATSSSEENAKQKEWFKQVNYISFNLNSIDPNKNYFNFFQEPDLLIHLAWEGLPNYKSDFHTKINLPLQSLFLNNLIDNGLNDITITGTCFEYGMKEGCLSEDMGVHPANPYAVAKNELCKYLQQLQKNSSFNLKWVRLFYMYGFGQNPNSLLSQLDSALDKNEKVFNMTGGQQVRDYLPVETVAEYVVKIALQNKIQGVINCCSGNPVTVEKFVREYLEKKNKKISLNLGYYPYPDFEPMAFWGDNKKLKRIINNE